MTEVAKQVGLAGRTIQGAIDALVDALVAKGDIPADQADAAKRLGQKAYGDDATYASLRSGKAQTVEGCGKQGFNLHDLLFSPAYAQAAVAGCVAATAIVGPEVLLAVAAVVGIVAIGVQIYKNESGDQGKKTQDNSIDAPPASAADDELVIDSKIRK